MSIMNVGGIGFHIREDTIIPAIYESDRKCTIFLLITHPPRPCVRMSLSSPKEWLEEGP